MADIALQVGGQVYEGWLTARVTRSMESLAGSFEVSYSDRWSGRSQPWPIAEEDECSVRIGRQVVLTGHVDRRSISIAENEHTLTVHGRDRAAAMVDCSAVLTKWEFAAGAQLQRIAETLAQPFGVGVSLQSGLILPALVNKVAVDPGDSAWEALEKVCRVAGVLPVSDGQGGVVLTRAGSTRAATALVLGQNILAISTDFDCTGTFRTYKVVGQRAGTDEDFGLEACSVLGEASDAGVKRESRVQLVRAESMVTRAQARARAQWEATVRAGRAATAQVTVSGWTQGNQNGRLGESLWPVNALVQVQAPPAGLNGDMLITEATYSLDGGGGTTTQLSLKRPDAFKPEPVVPVPGRWKELG